MYLHPTAGWLASWRSCSAGKIWSLVAGNRHPANTFLSNPIIYKVSAIRQIGFRCQCSGVSKQIMGIENKLQ